MSRDDAVLKMVDSNLHREHLLPSEKAFAYKMKMDALKHQGQALSQVATKSDSAEEIGAQVGESRDVVYRYIRLTHLVRPLLNLVDAGRIAFMPAELRAYFPDQTPRQMRLSIMKILEEKNGAENDAGAGQGFGQEGR